ncbi:MAG: GGDEF domain-containing protein [Myxococcota bacterium]
MKKPRKTTTAITVISKIRDQAVSQTAALVVIHGEDLGKKYDLDDELVIGRSSKCDVQVDQDSVSRNHARVHVESSKIAVKDLGSTNGTFVNDEQITGDHPLRNGDLIKIGRTIFKFIASNNIEAAYHDEIYRLTTVDGLTQVSNRRYFEDTLDRELSRCRRYQRSLSLVLVDVDHFKRINDTWGHLAGDAVLKEVATTIRRRIRREDVIARYGGEEFALLLPEIDLKGAVAMAEKVRKLVEKHTFQFDGEDIPVTISAGVSALAKKNETGAALVKRADAKLYEAKDRGRNRVCS